LQRKLAAVEVKFGKSLFERRHYALLAVMCLTLKLPERERKRQGRFVRRAEKRVCPTKLTQHRRPIHPHWSVPASADEARKKRLIRRQD